MRHVIFTALALAVLMLAVCAVPWTAPNTQAQVNPPTTCCGKKPSFSDPAYSTVFTGQVAVATQFVPDPGGYVLGVYDLKNQSTAPLGQKYVTPVYHGPPGAEWTKTRLGNVLGLTLDDQGNIYTTATKAYNSDFFPPGATGGEIYKIDGVTGITTVFQTPPNTMHAGLGNINYDCEHKNFYVSDTDDGRIYRLDTSGNILSTWDHGANLGTAIPSSAPIPDIPSQIFTPFGRRIGAVQANNGQLYYGVCFEDFAINSTRNNEVWSVALTPGLAPLNGDFVGPARREISLPPFTPGGVSTMPIFDLSFGPTGMLLVAERTMSNADNSGAHSSRILEYVGPLWALLNPNKYLFNASNTALEKSSTGGVDYDFSPNGLVWGMGDALLLVPDSIYGIEGLPPTGGNAANSILIDLDQNFGDGTADKYQMGDVEIPCPDGAVQSSCRAEFAASTVCLGQATTFTDLSSGATSWSWNFGDNTSSTQPNPTHTYATAGPHTVTLTVNGGACTVPHTIIVTAGPQPPVISGPATTCQPGTYPIPPQPGTTVSWSVTNGTPATGTGNNINVTWNPTGNGLVVVTLTNIETCCKSTAQLLIHACDISSACCEGLRINAVLKSFVGVGGGLYTFTPTLTAGPANITHVSASVLSTSLIYSPVNCGISGAANSYIASATSPAGFASSLPVQFTRDVEWAASNSAGVNISGGLDFPFDIQFQPPPSSLQCRDNLSFCVKYTFTDVNCRSCEVIRCYGPYTRSGGTSILNEKTGSASQISTWRTVLPLDMIWRRTPWYNDL
jgi:PKD repeat protein